MNRTQTKNDGPKRTYRACYPCRSRKLKCNFGDPNSPSEGPCQRCRREGRDCEKVEPTVINPSKRQRLASERSSHTSSTLPDPAILSHVNRRSGLNSQTSTSSTSHITLPSSFSDSVQMDTVNSQGHTTENEEPDEDSDHSTNGEHDALWTSNIQNPHEALQLLASASSVTSKHIQQDKLSPSIDVLPKGNRERKHIWSSWEPVKKDLLTLQEAENLLSFFEVEMSPLYPIHPKVIFTRSYLHNLVINESFSLGAMLAIASRYSVLLVDGRDEEVHHALSRWLREQMLYMMDGDSSLRTISTVEALLVLSEWPLLPLINEKEMQNEEPPADDLDSSHLLKPSLRYDQHSWTQIGLAVRIAQELGLHNRAVEAVLQNRSDSWEKSRMLKTWTYCYNADRHISVRLGRNAVLQNYMSAQWWEQVSDLVSRRVRGRGSEEVWVEDTYAQSLIACLIGTIQEHLYPNKEVTRSILRTGAWESFLRSLRLELQFIKRSCQNKLKEKGVDAVMLQIEIDYVTLYANALALRALQEKLKRRREAQDLYYVSPSLLNLVEGPWILEALAAARSIVQLSVDTLAGKGYLRYCPARIFQRVVFAATFLFKALALGVVEHGQQTVLELLGSVIDALRRNSCDEQHLPRGFAELLDRLYEHRQSLIAQTGTRRPSLNQPAPPPQAQNVPASLPTTTSNIVPDQSLTSDAANNALEFPLGSLFSNLINTQSTPTGSAVDNILQNNQAQALEPAVSNLGNEEVFWGFAPELFPPAVDVDQDAMLQSLWNLDTVDPTSLNLWDTLFGDTGTVPSGTFQ